MITKINESKHLQNLYHKNINVNLMVENVIQIKSGIMIDVGTMQKVSYMWRVLYLESYYIFVAKMVNI